MEHEYKRNVDAIGRIVLPSILRELYGIFPGESVEVIATREGILLKPIKSKNA